MMGTTGRAIALMLMAVAAAACGTRGAGTPAGGSDEVLARSAVPGLVGRSCEFINAPSETPPFSTVARLGTRGNVALWGLDAAASDSVIVSVRYGDDGRLDWVRAIGSSVPPDRVASLERLLLESVYEQGPADWGVRLRVVAGDLAGLEPSVVCPVETRRSGGRLPVFLPTSERGFAALERVRGRSFPAQISLDDQGRIVDVRLGRSSGYSVVDQFLLDWIHGTQFHPKLHDGIGVPATIERTFYIPRRR